ncbi:uncharacterized protein C1orf198 homolog [Coccinella septempunctata]|uniref:uncharacterized protein C1orf198 homolog n=1 Tax=Coccinella septempunctata TaxID=41139 RepID=UPI001D06A089|nr:uncharacterized protein C1orf198 homolog [Coccinella septempunctata]
MDLNKRAEEYFSSMNSIASRIYNDINQTKAAYEDLWNTLSPDEQEQILNESIIKPEVQIKYNYQDEGGFKKSQEYSSKIIIDENNCSYRDEHSAPFSFKTRSQRDLSILTSKDTKMKKPNRVVNIPRKPAVKEIEPVKQKIDLEEVETDNSSNDLLPKTGLDFLDNW